MRLGDDSLPDSMDLIWFETLRVKIAAQHRNG